MTIGITGITGYIGSQLLNRLINQGHTIRALIHKKPPTKTSTQIEYITGDLQDKTSLKKFTKNLDTIIHCAALVKDYGPRHQFYTINYQGTKNLVNTCPTSLNRFIYLGHIDYSHDKNNPYTRSKQQTEHWLTQHHQDHNFPSIIIRPGNVYGPEATTWVLRPLRAIQHNRIRLINHGSGIFHHTYIDNLIDAVLLAHKSDVIYGETLDITDNDTTITWKRYFNDLATMLNKPPIKKNLSKSTALIIAHLSMLTSRLFNTPPLISPMAVKIFTNTAPISIQKAQQQLHYQPKITYPQAIKEINKWVKGTYLRQYSSEKL
jgi:nucleoside-diphosphate-sugar epimerase